MIQTLLTGIAGVTFFTGFALRFYRLDEYYRKKARQNFKKRLLRSSAASNKRERKTKDNMEIQKQARAPVHYGIETGTISMCPEINSEDQCFI